MKPGSNIIRSGGSGVAIVFSAALYLHHDRADRCLLPVQRVYGSTGITRPYRRSRVARARHGRRRLRRTHAFLLHLARFITEHRGRGQGRSRASFGARPTANRRVARNHAACVLPSTNLDHRQIDDLPDRPASTTVSTIWPSLGNRHNNSVDVCAQAFGNHQQQRCRQDQ